MNQRLLQQLRVAQTAHALWDRDNQLIEEFNAYHYRGYSNDPEFRRLFNEVLVAISKWYADYNELAVLLPEGPDRLILIDAEFDDYRLWVLPTIMTLRDYIAENHH